MAWPYGQGLGRTRLKDWRLKVWESHADVPLRIGTKCDNMVTT